MSEAARSRRIEPNFSSSTDRSAAPRADRFPPPAGDPLAELARLVGQDDPFKAMFNAPVSPRAAAPAPLQNSHAEPVIAEQEHDLAETPHEGDTAPAMHAPDGWHEADVIGDYPAESEAELSSHSLHDDAPEQPVDYDAAVEAEGEGLYDAPTTAPDLWSEPTVAEPVRLADESASTPPVPRRPLVVLFAVLALTGGGLAATFLARTGTSIAATNNGGAPVILASTAPTKIQQLDSATPGNAEEADAALLSRNGETKGGAVKVLPSQEQPIDLAQLPKADPALTAAGDALPTTSRSPFPEPRMVKTFLVRADGTMIPTGAAGGVAPRSLDGMPQMAALPAAVGGVTPPMALPRTPKAGTRTPTTPKASPPTDDGPAADATDTVAPKQKQPPSPGPHAATPKPKPTEVADASSGTDDAAAPQSGGGFSLQLAASPSETDAREAFTRLQKKYSQLGSYQPHVKKAGTPDKPVYRLRVGSMDQSQAKTLCSQLQASGGSCFVVRN